MSNGGCLFYIFAKETFMKEKHTHMNRRSFFKKMGTAAGAGALLAAPVSGRAAEKKPLVPKRPFGRTGVDVSILSLGGMFDIPNNQLLMRQALKWGITYWDTANSYEGGDSEKGIGKFFAKYPRERKNIFLVTKSGAWTLKGMKEHLDLSLRRMNTSYVDLFFVHSVSNIRADISDKTRKWAEKAKAEGKIRFFGFSTHSNMDECLLRAARLGWIDGIMLTYNFRLMDTDEMKRAIDACHKAGIGLTAMKTQGSSWANTGLTDRDTGRAARFLSKGFSEEQARLLAVWENPRVASICSQMPSLRILKSNREAALAVETGLSEADRDALRRHAAMTMDQYCAGCTKICQSVLPPHTPVGDVMRCLMYQNAYHDRKLARRVFQELPKSARQRLAGLDFSEAQESCPRNIPIGRAVRQALRDFA